MPQMRGAILEMTNAGTCLIPSVVFPCNNKTENTRRTEVEEMFLKPCSSRLAQISRLTDGSRVLTASVPRRCALRIVGLHG
jgi:hypothetical protein